MGNDAAGRDPMRIDPSCSYTVCVYSTWANFWGECFTLKQRTNSYKRSSGKEWFFFGGGGVIETLHFINKFLGCAIFYLPLAYCIYNTRFKFDNF
jgi:hypothetical protein